jgi:hypothetical protein
MTMDNNLKRWTAKLKIALVVEIIHGKTAVSGAEAPCDLTPSEIEA